MKKIIMMLSAAVLVSCSDANSENSNANNEAQAQQTAINTQAASDDHGHDHGNPSGFVPNFIKAASLKQKMESGNKVYIFDVRDKMSYEKAHITGALSTPIPITITSAPLKDVPMDAEIVTYCGCPHHLSSIGAEQLTKLGYKNVSVLDEGFWHWKDNKYPVVENGGDNKLSMVTVEGIMQKSSTPVKNTDIYMKHVKTGQLEATRTDNRGYYKMTFHLYDYEKKDLFKFYMKDLDTPVQDFKTEKEHARDVVVNVL